MANEEQGSKPMKAYDKLFNIYNKKITLFMLFGALSLLGIISFFYIPIRLMPNTTYPGLIIRTEYHGVSPDKIEEIITIPLENYISMVGGIKRIYSTSEEGKSEISIEFSRSVNIEVKAAEIRAIVDIISGSFPDDVQEPALLQYDPDDHPVITVSVIDDQKNLNELREIADREIKKALEGIYGVSEVFVSGGAIREILVAVDMQKLETHAISMREIVSLLQLYNINSSAGKIEKDGGHFSIYVKGRFKNINQIRELNLYSNLTRGNIKLKDIANVLYAYREQDSASRINGEERVNIYVHKFGSANLLDLSKSILSELEKLKRENLDFEIVDNKADLINEALFNITILTLVGAILSLFILHLCNFYLFESLLILLNIPIAFIISSFFLYLFNIDYNLITISGVIISAGMNICFALVTLLSIKENGIKKGIQRIFIQIAFIIILICSIFLPIMFAAEEMKIIYGSIAIVLFLSMSASFMISSLLMPILWTRGLENQWKIELPFKLNKKYIKMLLFFKTEIKKYFSYINRISFEYTIQFISHKKYFFIIYIVFIMLGILFYYSLDEEFINPLEEKKIYANIEFNSGTNFAVTNTITKKVEKILLQYEEIKKITSKVDPAHSNLYIELEDSGDVSEEFIEKLKNSVKKINEAFVYFTTRNACFKII